MTDGGNHVALGPLRLTLPGLREFWVKSYLKVVGLNISGMGSA